MREFIEATLGKSDPSNSVQLTLFRIADVPLVRSWIASTERHEGHDPGVLVKAVNGSVLTIDTYASSITL